MAALAKSLGYFLLICFLSHQFHLTINAANPTKSFSLKLIHRDSPESPLYPGNLSHFEKIKRIVHFSESRLLYLHSKAAAAAKYSSTTTNQKSIIHPDLIRPPVGKSLGTFLYLVELAIGPSAPYYLALDTGSDLIWTQCTPCEPCFTQLVTPTFDPTKSTTFRTLQCGHPYCKPPLFACINGLCQYNIQYVKGNSIGYLSNETFTFDAPHTLESLRDIVFGCSVANKDFNFPGDVDGVLGMDAGELSLISQMGDEANKRFSYCLVDPDIPGFYSFLTFGNDINLQGNVQSTPFVRRPDLAFYALKLLDISVGNHRLHLDHRDFELKPDGTGGCIIDSGTSISFIDAVPYETFKSAIIAYFQGKLTPIEQKDAFLDLCFRLPPGDNDLPSVTFHFEDRADLFVGSQHLFLYNSHENSYCLLINPSKDHTLLGAMQQINIRFQYDLGLQRLSFVPVDCLSQVF